MNLLLYAQNEIRRRTALLPREVKEWSDIANVNQNNFGIHKSQFEALKIMMAGLLERQRVLLEGFKLLGQNSIFQVPISLPNY